MAHVHAIVHLPSCPAKGHKGTCIGCEWRRYGISALIALSLGVLEFGVSRYYFRSVAGEGDALHLLGDFLQSGVSTAIAYFAVRRAQEEGLRRIGAYVQSGGFLIVTALIVLGAIAHDERVRDPLLLIVLGLSMTAGASVRIAYVHPHWNFRGTVADIVRALRRRGVVNVTQIAEVLHVFIDFATSVAVTIVGLHRLATGSSSLDVILALFFIAPCAFVSAVLVFALARHHH